MKLPLVTVFIPLYNCETYIGEALDSIISQTYPNLEILIIDDGSTDDSANIVSSYTDSRIRFLKNNRNQGIPYTRNRGLLEAKGKYMAIMDADDIAYSNRIERQTDFMQKHPEIDALGSYYEIFGGRINKTLKPAAISPEEIRAGLLFLNRISNPTSFIRLETLRTYSIHYNPEYFVAQDYDMWVQLSKAGYLSILPEVLMKYRTGHANITRKSKSDKTEKRRQVNAAIHRDILNYYQFNLTDEELRIFNAYFNDNYQSKLGGDTVAKLPEVLAKMIVHNQRCQLFNGEIFTKIMRDAVLTVINRRKLPLRQKLYLYHRICKQENIRTLVKDLIYMVPKHIYNRLLI